MPRYCQNCGERLDEGDRFCFHCGEAVSGDSTAHGTTGAEDDEWGSGRQPSDEWGGRRQTDDEWGDRRQTGEEYSAHGPSGPSGQGLSVPRKNAIDTLSQSLSWLFGFPLLIGAFLVLDLLNTAGELVSPLFSLLSTVLALLVGGVAYLYVDKLLRDEPIEDTWDEFQAAADYVLGRLVSLIGIFIVYIITVTIGLLLLVLPGIYLGARLVLAFPACVLDEQSAFESLSTSWEVAHGNVVKLVGIFLVLVFASLAIAFVGVTTGGLEALDNPVFYLIIAPVSAILTGMVEMAIARVYLENRA